jgi:hypothetical protein
MVVGHTQGRGEVLIDFVVGEMLGLTSEFGFLGGDCEWRESLCCLQGRLVMASLVAQE